MGGYKEEALVMNRNNMIGSSFRYLWAFPYAVIVSLPYFVNDLWAALEHLYNNVSFETMFLVNEE